MPQAEKRKRYKMVLSFDLSALGENLDNARIDKATLVTSPYSKTKRKKIDCTEWLNELLKK